MTFKPKKDLLYGIIIWIGPLILIPFLSFYYSLELLIVFIASILLSLWIWFSTEYRIEDNELYIKSWVLRKRIKLSDIMAIRKVENIYSSYALSVKRLEIDVKSFGKTFIAPDDFDNFINEIRKKNSNIMFND